MPRVDPYSHHADQDDFFAATKGEAPMVLGFVAGLVVIAFVWANDRPRQVNLMPAIPLAQSQSVDEGTEP